MRGPTDVREWRIRAALPGDAAACAEVYAPYVRDTPISLEDEPPDAAELARRIEAAHVWLVAEGDGIGGFAYASRHNPRAAYRWSADVSVYVGGDHQRRGLGRALYETLFDELRDRGFCTLCAGITVPNEASFALHEALGFEPVGTYRRIGFKLGRWHDVAWLQLDISDGRGEPPRWPGPRG